MIKHIDVQRPNYTMLKIVPYSSLRNYNSGIIIKMVADMYRSFFRQFNVINENLVVETSFKATYVIDIQKDNVVFGLIVPKQFVGMAKEKISGAWERSTITEVPITDLQYTNGEVLEYEQCYALDFKNYDSFSLNVDKRANTSLSGLLNVLDVMQDNDRVTVVYNLIPCGQDNWHNECKAKHQLYIDNQRVAKKPSPVTVMNDILNVSFDFVEDLLNFGESRQISPLDETRQLLSMHRQKLSPNTVAKANAVIVKCQGAIISQSNNNDRSVQNGLSVCQSYYNLHGDNEIVYKRSRVEPVLTDYTFVKYPVFRISVDEGRELVQLAGKDLLDKWKIEHNTILEKSVPDELMHGYIKTGKCLIKGKKYQTYLSTDKEISNLPVVISGSQGSGKSTFITEYVKDVLSTDEGAIIIDYIKNCEVADEIIKITPKNRLKVLDLTRECDLQAFAYNEFKPIGHTPYEITCSANLHQQQLTALLDALAIGEPLTPKMRKYFTSMADICLINEGISLKNIINALEDVEIRHKFIDKVPQDYIPYLEDEIRIVQELDDVQLVKDKDENGELVMKKVIIGTKMNLITNIIDRVNLLREDMTMRYMFNKSSKDNVDFVKLMNEGKVVVIKMPSSRFTTEHILNVLVTFFINKIWLSCQIRGQQKEPKRVHLLLDEIFQAPTSYGTLDKLILQCRKFRLKLVFTVHLIGDLKQLGERLRGGAGTSFILLQGSDKNNYRFLEEQFAVQGFEIDDMINLKRFHALNLIACNEGNGKSAFISDYTIESKKNKMQQENKEISLKKEMIPKKKL